VASGPQWNASGPSKISIGLLKKTHWKPKLVLRSYRVLPRKLKNGDIPIFVCFDMSFSPAYGRGN
jgi:hypothetical protein